jgi:tetratricopeptide (TPR) repeat protein
VKKVRTLLLVVGVVAAGTAAFFVWGDRKSEWTTSSPVALAEFREGQNALMKLYYDEAREHFGRALALDPEFLTARCFLAQLTDDGPESKRKELLAGLRTADLTRLTAREQFLIRHFVAGSDHDYAKARAVLSEFATSHPEDPFALEMLAQEATNTQEWDKVRRLFSKEIEVAPNRVTAYNQLGYLEMAQSRFADAEKMFLTYRYIAPNQANPHDSLGELFILTGRFVDAEAEFADALRVKPEFCSSYQHLITLYNLWDRLDKANEVVARVGKVKACAYVAGKETQCTTAEWAPFLKADWEALWHVSVSSCEANPEGVNFLRFLAAVATGRTKEADEEQARVSTRLTKLRADAPSARAQTALLNQMQACRLLADGKAAQAAVLLRDVDTRLTYRGLDDGGLQKLFNRLVLVAALERSGDVAGAKVVRAETEGVNAAFVGRFLPIVEAVNPVSR